MRDWLDRFFSDLGFFFQHAWTLIQGRNDPETEAHRIPLVIGAILSCTLMGLAAVAVAHHSSTFEIVSPAARPNEQVLTTDLTQPVRPEPRRFKARSHLPRVNERIASGAVNPKVFLPKYDLIRIDDNRVWWESDHDRNDTEDDHVVHRALEIPLRRLIELTSRQGGTLKIQDTYRPEGIHARRSLHREGRAADLTCDELGLEKLAKLCWAAGFDWVYFEAPKRGGTHVHVSVRADR